MTRLALEEFPVAVLADEFPIAHGDLPAHGDDTGTAFDFPAFKRAVIEIHVLRLHGNFAAIVWVIDHQVGVRAGLDRAFAREEIERLRDLRAGDVYKRVQVNLPRLHAVGVEQVDAFFERRYAVGDFCKIIFAHRLLRLEIERAMVGGDGVHQPVAQAVPKHFLIPLVAQRSSPSWSSTTMRARPPSRSSCWCLLSCCCSRSTCCNGGSAAAWEGGPRSMAAAAHAVAGASLARRDPPWLRAVLIAITLLFLGLFLFLPLLTVFLEAFRKGVQTYFVSFTDPAARSAIVLTLITAGISVPCNLLFGLVASWAIAKFKFRGKNLLITLIDLPFAVSPVISGLIFVLMFGAQGWFGPW